MQDEEYVYDEESGEWLPFYTPEGAGRAGTFGTVLQAARSITATVQTASTAAETPAALVCAHSLARSSRARSR